jgi:hypothetical protein
MLRPIAGFSILMGVITLALLVRYHQAVASTATLFDVLVVVARESQQLPILRG